jgi:signal transduction histidine kinase
MGDSKIELFFLKNLLQIALVGISIILAADLMLTHYDSSSIAMDLVILGAVVTSFILLKAKKWKSSVVVITLVPLVTMFYHAIKFEDTTVPMTVILAIGFTYSIMLKGKLMWSMQFIVLVTLLCIYGIQALNPEAYLKDSVNEVIAQAITIIVLNILLVFSAGTLKARYDRINRELKLINFELNEKTFKIEMQNEELVQSQEKLNALNQFLEQTVVDRTTSITKKNEQLLRYAYVNAHHVRGPVARVLGLIQLSKIDANLELPFLFDKIETETREIDSIITKINGELEKTVEESVH